jgi:multiple sugar transport system ATP-binding protein
MIYVTHDQVEAMTMADKIVVLRAGRIEQVGSPLDLYNAPVNTFVAGFIGSPRMNFLPVKLLPASVQTQLAVGTDTVGIRPEHAVLDDSGPLRMTITQVEQLGASSLLHGTVGDQTPFEMVLHGQTRIKRGDVVGLGLPGADTHGFDKDGLRLA